MSDIIEEAIEESEKDREREASGVVNGRDVVVKKKKHHTRIQRTKWKVAVYLDGNDYSEKQKTGLNADQAEDEFNHLVNQYDLSEEYHDQNSHMAGHMTTETNDSFLLPVERGDTVLIQDENGDSIYSKHEIHAITDTGLLRTTNGTYGKAEFMRMIKDAGEVKIEYE